MQKYFLCHILKFYPYILFTLYRVGYLCNIKDLINGTITSNINGNLLRGVRPVINIVKTAKVSGDGAIDNPYQIMAN